MRRVLGNFAFLARGRGVAAVLMLGSTMLMARALGPDEFGLVVLIQAYTLLVRGLLDFQSYEAVVRYGVPLHDAGDTPALRRLITVCRRVDRRASLIATALALVAAPLVGPSLGLDRAHVLLLAGYSLALLATGNGTSGGLLRLFDQFDALGRQMAIGPIVRFTGVALAWWLQAPAPVFVGVLALAFTSENLYLNWVGRREYRRRVGPPPPGATVSDARLGEFAGLRGFLWVTYWQANMDLVPKHVSTVLASYLMGPAEAGLLRLGRELASPLSRAAVLIRQVVFLDLTRSWHQRTAAFAQIAYRTALLGLGLGLALVVTAVFFGDRLLVALVGAKFLGAAPIVTLMLLAATFDLAGSSLRSAAYAIGQAGKVLRLHAVAAVVYLVLFVALTSWLGLIGAGIGASLAAAVPPVAMALLIRRGTREGTPPP